MAVTFNSRTLGRTGTNYSDYPENIIVDPDLNGRHENSSVEQLAADILKHGQHTPVLFRKNDAGKPVLVYGHRRWRAISLLRQQGHDIKIFGNYETMDEVEAFTAAIGENRFRKDVSPIDDAANIKVLTSRFKMTVEDIAAIYFPEADTEEETHAAVRFVKQRMSLIELSAEAAKAVRDGRIKSVTAAVALAKLSKDQQREKLAEKSTGKIKGKDLKAPKISLATKLRRIVESLLSELKDGELENPDNEFLALDRKKFKKLCDALGVSK